MIRRAVIGCLVCVCVAAHAEDGSPPPVSAADLHAAPDLAPIAPSVAARALSSGLDAPPRLAAVPTADASHVGRSVSALAPLARRSAMPAFATGRPPAPIRPLMQPAAASVAPPAVRLDPATVAVRARGARIDQTPPHERSLQEMLASRPDLSTHSHITYTPRVEIGQRTRLQAPFSEFHHEP
ncbi:hypothetical protein [Burkholderia anthina]|uniref:hypothetical protein n=1 Tax=Burkholderia anthina TaxID=179879 RepID=UPI00158E1703|nr:hypothetical protein [Burkholderia anthina]